MTPPPQGGIPCATCVKYTIFRWRLRRLLSFSYALLYSLFSRFWLSFLMQNRIIHLFWVAPWAPMNLLIGVFLSSFWLSFLMQNRIIHLFWLAPLAPMILLIDLFLSIIFEFLVEFSHAKSCTNHYVRVLFFHEQFHCRFLTLNTTARKNDWMTHTDRDSLWDS